MSQVKFDFTSENYVVTGASSGMGRQITLELAEAGAKVLAIARGREALEEVQKQYPENIIIASVDVCDSDNLELAINNFVKVYGKLNGAVHAAGISKLTPLRGYDENEARKIMDISFWSGINLVKIISKAKNSVAGLSIVLFSSVSARSGEKAMFAYASTKAAMLTAVKTIAKEISAKKHRINCVTPGWVVTPMSNNLESDTTTFIEEHLLGVGHPDDVSGTVLFLLSDRAKWITGTDIVVDGGYLA